MLPGPNTSGILPALRLVVNSADGSVAQYEFRRPFLIGRGTDNDVCVLDACVSRTQAEVSFVDGSWQVRDLNSSNGIFQNGARVPVVQVGETTTIRLGSGGPFVVLNSESSYLSVTHESVAAKYFSDDTSQPAGAHTMLVRKAYAEVRQKNHKQWLSIVGILVIALGSVLAYAIIQRRAVARQRATAESLFYSIRSLDVDVAGFEKIALETNSYSLKERLKTYQEKRRGMEKRYDQYLKDLRVGDAGMTPRKKLIMRVARIFGECELTIPPFFEAEVEKYIDKWKSTRRLEIAIKTAKAKGYVEPIARDLLAGGLPPQFFYLALQESNFDEYVSGPETRLGIAKGMWQFIPSTAASYGMKVGPLVNLRRPDPADDRHHWEIATKAAARYMKDLYATDAQASGLLIMACYNWGEGRVLPLIRSLPQNPSDRNFWKVLTRYREKIPAETYDYVFSIFSAAVIGEDPKLFGFSFDNPLAAVTE